MDAVDIIIGGFPCQDLSVAGGRKGLEGERSGLFYEFIRIVRDMPTRPSFVVVENVPGMLTSNNGRDFASFSMKWSSSGVLNLSHGEHWTVDTSEFPKNANECSLSQILQENAHQKYLISKPTCEGILERVKERETLCIHL